MRRASPPFSYRALLAVFSALLFAAAQPNELFRWGQPLLGFLALTPYFLALARTYTVREAVRLGMLFGALSTAITNYWLMFFGEFSVWTLGGVTLAYLLFHALLAPILARFCDTKRTYRPFALAVAWVGYEYLKSVGFLGFPWGLMAYPLHGVDPLVQHAEVTGVWALSFLVVLVNGALFEILSGAEMGDSSPTQSFPRWFRSPAPLPTAARFRYPAWLPTAARFQYPAWLTSPAAAQVAVAAVVALAMLLFGWARLASPLPVARTAEILLVQQNADSWSNNPERAIRTAQRLTTAGLSARAEHRAEKPGQAAPASGAGQAATASGADQAAKPSGTDRAATASGAGSRPSGPVDLVVWSETSLRYPYRNNQGLYRRMPAEQPFVSFLRGLPAPLLTGAPYIEDQETIYNAAVLITPQAELVDYYGKQHLVPFAEHIPFWEVPAVRGFFQNAVGIGAVWSPGREFRLFDVRIDGSGRPASDGSGREDTTGGRIRIATPICFEDSFGYIGQHFARNGADLFVNLTNNSWSRSESAQIQHFVSARFRAIENRIPLVRSTNSGLTGVVDGYGRLTQSVPMFREASLNVSVPIYEEMPDTLYTRFGDWLGQAAVLGSVFIALFLRLRRVPRGSTHQTA
jgi:apolipoprotein N-acyltransferase